MENKHTKDRLPSRGRTPLSPALLPHSADPTHPYCVAPVERCVPKIPHVNEIREC